jgi:hypothetical protein
MVLSHQQGIEQTTDTAARMYGRLLIYSPPLISLQVAFASADAYARDGISVRRQVVRPSCPAQRRKVRRTQQATRVTVLCCTTTGSSLFWKELLSSLKVI